MKKPIIFIFGALFFAAGSGAGNANVEHLKIYRQAYPDFKPNCMYCHIDKKPKKDTGKHDLNLYGIKFKELGETLTKEQILELGSHEEFEKKTAEGEVILEEKALEQKKGSEKGVEKGSQK